MRQRQKTIKQIGSPNEKAFIIEETKTTDLSKEFKLERYRYILGQLQALNDNAHKYLALFQTLATAIVGGGVGLFVSRKSLNIDPQVTRIALQAMIGLLIILACFVIISLVGGMFSWLDYRREEVELLNEVVEPGFRKMPRLRNFWRWYESYVLVFVISVVVIIFVFVEGQLIPLVH